MAEEGIKIRVKAVEDAKSGPLLVTFPQGPPPEESLTGSDSAKFPRLVCQYTEQAENRKRKHRCITAENSVTTFEGKNYGEGAVKNGAQYYLGVYNAKRKRLDIYPAEGDTVFGLQLKSVRAESTGADTSAVVSGGLEDTNMRERRDMVIQDFGSKKKQKMEKSRKANIVDVTAIDAAEDVARHLKDNSAAAGAGEKAEATQSKIDAAIMEARIKTLPPFNIDAKKPADAYPVETIITEDIVYALEPSAHAFIAQIEDDDADLNEVVFKVARHDAYLKDRLQILALALKAAESSKQKAALRTKLHALLYMKWLLALHNAPQELQYREIKPARTEEESAEPAAEPEPNRIAIPSLRFLPDAAVDILLSQFTESRDIARSSTTQARMAKVYTRTGPLTDRLRSYIAVLSLIIDDFELDIGLLAKDMKLVPAKLADLYKEAGCFLTSVRAGEAGEIVGSKSKASGPVVSYKVRLTTPLNFPKLKLGRRK